jgi:general secretion pathway protein L
MHVLSIDVGTYSVKYISSFVEKRRVNHVEMSEVILHDYINDHPELNSLEAQATIVRELLDTIARPDTRVIFQANNEMLTNRFLTLPVKSKKKAELMLPFQLEEDIPFALSEIHYGHRMESAKTQHLALVSLVRETTFEAYYNTFRSKNALPTILTSEASAVENFFNQNAIAGPFCVLDIGHTTTKAYFFYNSRLIVTHSSYMGGHDINQMIAQTYKIEPDEAIFYKHQNAFLLTSTQFDEVDSAQREFATAMDRIFSTLNADFSRWKIGFKINFGLSLQHIFITGGTSNIKNITNYLTEKWETKVVLLETFDKIESEKIDLNPKNKSKYALANMMASGMKRKNRFINLLSGKFAQTSTSEIPLHSFAFLGVRVASVALVLLFALLTERFFIQKDIKFVNTKLNTVTKNSVLAINGRLRRSLASNPKPILDSLVKRQRGVRQEISTVQSAIETKALSPLVIISQIAASSQATLIEFKTTDIGEISATFEAQAAGDLNNLKAQFERSTLTDVVAVINQANLQLTLTASGF